MTSLAEDAGPNPQPSSLVALSLGGGVQSTTLLLMALRGEFETKPDCAIFADTGWEPPAVYEHLDWLEAEIAPFPIHRVSVGNIRDDTLGGHLPRANGLGKRFATMPFHLRNLDGDKGMLRRQCTNEYKVRPIRKRLRELQIGTAPVELWIGISLDEHWRMKGSGLKWVEHRWPLIEKRMSRQDCLLWLERNEYRKAPKSACVGCPFHSDATWRDLKINDPDSFKEAVEFEKSCKSLPRIDGEVFLHPSLKPLDQVEFHEGQLELNQFLSECEGLCGV